MYKYAIEIFYSSGDKGRTAVVPTLPGSSAPGETEEEALNEVLVAIKLWLETAEKEGREVPSPRGNALLADLAARQTAGV